MSTTTCPMADPTKCTRRYINGLSKDEMDLPDSNPKCAWKADKKFPGDSPHTDEPLDTKRVKVYDNILQVIGRTPLVKMHKMPKILGLKCNLYAKCEFLNPGGSVKDRIAYRMILDMEAAGKCKPGDTFIEPTSGNTGMGIALASAVKGYKCIIVMPEKMSNEKMVVLSALGARIIRTPTEAAYNDEQGVFAVAQKLQKEIPNSHILNQYKNPGNSLAHYQGTGAEIVDDLDGKVDMIVMGAGTGGTIAGVGRYIAAKCPNCTIVCADPIGSCLAPKEMNIGLNTPYEVEGIGYDFHPSVFDRSVIHEWVKTDDKAAFDLARKLIEEEGFLCGGSSGSAMLAVKEKAKNLKEGQNCVVILPDNIRNYLSKFVTDSWMIVHDFLDVPSNDAWWWEKKVSELNLEKPEIKNQEETIGQIIPEMKDDIVIVVDSGSGIKGVATSADLLTKMIRGSPASVPISEVAKKKYAKVTNQATLGRVASILESEPFVLVFDKSSVDIHKQDKHADLLGVVTRHRLLNYIAKAAKNN